MSTYSLDQLRDAIVDVAENEWRHRVRDFADDQEATPHLIQRYFEEPGWSWFLDQYSDGTYTEQWKQHGYQEWCGLFVAFCGLRLGDQLDDSACVDARLRDDVAAEVLPSTKRLASPKQWCDGCPEFDRPGKMKLRRGDVITVGDGADGSHICLVREHRQPHNTFVQTVEGNAYGQLGSGTWGEGVVKRKRNFGEIKQTYRFTRAHFAGSALD